MSQRPTGEPSAKKSQQRSLEQDRAQAAWKCVKRVKDSQEGGPEYGRLARSAAADLQINGLGQTLAFWRAKAAGKTGSPHGKIHADVSRWVLSQLREQHADGLLGWIMAEGTTTNQYRLATAEAMAFLLWLRRFAEAELPSATDKK